MLPRHALARLRAHNVAHTVRRTSQSRLSSSVAAISRISPTVKPFSEDSDLKTSFDNMLPSSSTAALQPTGLFMNSQLRYPSDFLTLSATTIQRAKAIVNRISNAPTAGRHEMRNVVKHFDRLSDVLCGVIDMAELVRHAHPSPEWIEASNEAYEMLCSYMNVLNTNSSLYEVLAAAVSDPSIVAEFSEEERAVALVFLRDFERSGIDLPPLQRDQFVALSDEILQLGRQFMVEGSGEKGYIDVPLSKLRESIAPEEHSVLEVLKSRASRFSNKVRVHGGSWEAQMLLRICNDQEIRHDVFVASHKENPDNVETLETLLHTRATLAKLVGKPSYAHMILGDKMAQTPDNVLLFLRALGHHHRPLALKEVSQLASFKHPDSNVSHAGRIKAWDRDFYASQMAASSPPTPRRPSISTGAVFHALSELFSRLYGMNLRLAETTSGEVWHPDVRKLEVLDEDAGLIGWIYVDLFSRAGKQHGAAHYTVRCSRRVDHDDWAGDIAHADPEYNMRDLPTLESSSEMGSRPLRGKEGLRQLPIAVLCCDFGPPSVLDNATMLRWYEIETLFHEMGHALHSMIGQTDYHNVAGTRCATDFVELPSILMEHFLASGQVQALLTGNSRSEPDIVIPPRRRGAFPALDAHAQILLATLDQLYHSDAALNPSFSTTEALATLHDTLGVIPFVKGTARHTDFSHLYGYGALYYSYLFDQAIAARVWTQLFEADPFSREMGERYKGEVLRYGGGKEPWGMIGSLLNDPAIALGDQKAMEQVGRWGIDHSVSVFQ